MRGLKPPCARGWALFMRSCHPTLVRGSRAPPSGPLGMCAWVKPTCRMAGSEETARSSDEISRKTVEDARLDVETGGVSVETGDVSVEFPRKCKHFFKRQIADQ
eukprot:scaffold4387_cov126-Isochrysis_galbana.AAC.9